MGLLDNIEDPQTQGLLTFGLGLLNSRGNLGQSIGQAGMQTMQSLQATREAQMKRQLQEAQLAEMKQQAALREQQAAQLARQQAMLEPLLRKLQGGDQMPAVSNALAHGAQAGSVGPTVANAARLPAPSAGGLGGLNPNDLAALKAAGGPDLVDVFKLTMPNWQNVNGYMVNTNDAGFKGGFMPGVQVSQNGQATVTNIGPDGQPIVSAPRGALDTYTAYRNADEAARAGYDTTTVTPAGGQPQLTTRADVVKTIRGAQPKGERVDLRPDGDRVAILQGEYKSAADRYNAAIGKKDLVAAARAKEDMAALEREMKGAGVPKLGIQLQSPAEAKREVDAVAAEGDVAKADVAAADKSRDIKSQIKMARELLSLGPTQSGAGSLVDSGLSFFGTSTKGGDIAAKLDTISGWMVNNVPRMEGPQSNFDLQNYKTMAGLVGDRTKPISVRLAALDGVEQLQSKYDKFNGGAAPKPVIDELPKTAPKGARVRDTQTGKVLKFNGLSWVEEK